MTGRNGWRQRRFGRRTFLGTAGGAAAALLLGGGGAEAGPLGASGAARAARFGPLVRDPGGVLDLPAGFQYRILSHEGGRLSNGAPVPGDFDGMAAFPGPGGSTVLVRNHELRLNDRDTRPRPEPNPVQGRNPYRPNGTLVESGGTTGIVVGPDRREIRDFVTSSGTRNNCAGGPTPWGTWLTCEEDRTEGHGYVYEVMPDDPENDLSRTPITAMGFFSHEATGSDPETGIVYLTEDDFRGRIDTDDPNKDTRFSFLYRYIPNDLRPRPGALQQGGTLQALKIDERPLTDADFFNPGDRFVVRWVDVDPASAADSAKAQGAVKFNRLEGAAFAGGAFWFDDTAGGEKRLGQVYRYLPATNTLELFYEGTDKNTMESPDNIAIAPWGDLLFAEDGRGGNRLMGITPAGAVYELANNRVKVDPASDNLSELAGPCFSPDGRTLFLNIQQPGITFAIWGPFPPASAAAQRAMAFAAPPAHLAPRLSGEALEAAEKYGLSPLTAAAYLRHGVALY